MLQGTEDRPLHNAMQSTKEITLLLFTVNDGMAGENKVRYSRLASLLQVKLLLFEIYLD